MSTVRGTAEALLLDAHDSALVICEDLSPRAQKEAGLIAHGGIFLALCKDLGLTLETGVAYVEAMFIPAKNFN